MPAGLAATDNDLWVSDWAAGMVLQLVVDGKLLTKPVPVATDLVSPEGLAVAPDGNLLVEDFTHIFFMPLSAGLNIISLPLQPDTPYTARSLAEYVSATVVIKYDEALRKFVGFTPGILDDGFAIEGGKGYIVNVPTDGTVPFTGAARTNNPPIMAPPLAQSDDAWVFVVSGRFVEEAKDGYRVTIRNTRTNAVATDVVRFRYASLGLSAKRIETYSTQGSEYFAAAFADLNRKNVVEIGDRLELTVKNRAGEIVSDILPYTVTAKAIHQAFLPITLKSVGKPRHSLWNIPTKTGLLQNYPNPFNPETWIPYQLRDQYQPLSVDLVCSLTNVLPLQ